MSDTDLELLTELNPWLKFTQWVYNPTESLSDEFVSKLTEPPKKYRSDRSFIYFANIKAGLPRSISSFTVYICVCTDGTQLRDTSLSYSSMDISLLPCIATYSPVDIDYTNCYGDKCRQEFSPEDRGLWCTACFGELDYADDICRLLHSVDFADIPSSAIIHIERRSSSINSDDE
jgi:hypothetical protein